jgi:hypothetical protein
MKENCSGQHFERVEELFLAVEAFLRGVSADFLQTVFLEWEQRLPICCQSSGEYIE